MTNVPPPLQPVALGYAPPQRNDLRMIAIRQKGVIWCLLGYLGAIALQWVLTPELAVLGAVAAVAASVTAAVFVFMLAITLYGAGAGIALGIVTLIPLVGLIVLLVINGKATRELRQHGIKVGFMGANLNQVPQTPVL